MRYRLADALTALLAEPKAVVLLERLAEVVEITAEVADGAAALPCPVAALSCCARLAIACVAT